MVHNPQDGGRLKRPAVTGDTIAALATPPGAGGIGVIRISGSEVPAISRAVLGELPEPRRADYLPFVDGEGRTIDRGIAIYFPQPHSFTGEDVLELQGHGGPVVMDLLLEQVLAAGARMARPGEFSERAFLNGKLDLVQAEAVADLISSSSAAAARGAMQTLQGEFSKGIHQLVEMVVRLRTHVEAAIDFPEEEIDFLADRQLERDLAEITRHLGRLLKGSRQGSLLRDGMTVVIAGRPNAGKSSLLNRLSGRESAIVTPLPGTTRDLLREQITIDGMPLHVVDTAGLRAGGDMVEREGMRRARVEMERADKVILVVDDQEYQDPQWRKTLAGLPPQAPLTIVRNKIDLTGREPQSREGELGQEILISARTGSGMDLLREHLKNSAGFQGPLEGGFMARRRHLDALRRAQRFLEGARRQLQQGAGELLAEELRQVQQALGEITGEFCNEDLLDRIFSGFCIGK
ncbi:MAG TPA: tRNA uridine-5-carboxymethylaminomethyl(34) synthesis GTPase MnmE [Gammaproteobacteria bacterium]|nr:tRNA uridine-5-carboxymethylaminomethyl(34) synthesis GTPase MnmE [Gammaproteobacteria bacterium]